MALANLGSIATRVLNRFDDISVGISGELIDIVDEQRLFVEEWTGLNVGSVNIAEKFQPVLICLTAATALDYQQVEGGDSRSLTLGDFKVEKGKEGNLSTASDALRQQGMNKLKALGKTMRFKQVLA